MTTPVDPQDPQNKMGGIKKWLGELLVSVLENPRIQAVVKKLIGEIIREDVVPIIPVASAAAATAAINAALKKFPGLEGTVGTVVEVGEVIHDTRTNLNNLLPDIDDLLDSWRPKN